MLSSLSITVRGEEEKEEVTLIFPSLSDLKAAFSTPDSSEELLRQLCHKEPAQPSLDLTDLGNEMT